MRVTVLAFAALREALEDDACTLELPEESRVRDAWGELARQFPRIDALARSTRIARNGTLAGIDERLQDGDELALLPPVGGG